MRIEFALMVFASSFGGLNLYFYCLYGKYATDSFQAFSDCLYETNWFVLPNDIQKNFILIIGQAQKRIYYHGHGVINLDLETFCKVS